MSRRIPLIAGAVLMILLGLARGIGGLVLLVRGSAADPNIQAPEAAVTVLAAVLVALGGALVVAAVGILRRSRRAWFLGIGLVVAFVLDGAVNGYVFFGHPGDRGTGVNLLAAVLILLGLGLGHRALTGPRKNRPPAEPE
ncbi:hypothetical protein GW813_00470 [bacterium]|nr:hypothetical protein [bacterium]PJA75863.1 MAG: hypothetical protein CO151_04870 [bacterium CG_4_9_14_3_um_filter_65_15]